MAKIKRQIITSNGEDLEKLEPSYTAGGNGMHTCSYFAKRLAIPPKGKT